MCDCCYLLYQGPVLSKILTDLSTRFKDHFENELRCAKDALFVHIMSRVLRPLDLFPKMSWNMSLFGNQQTLPGRSAYRGVDTGSTLGFL